MTDRNRLPNRRAGYTIRLEVAGIVVHATANFDPSTMQPVELFLSGPKPGSSIAVLLEDAAVAISVALQHGVPPVALARSLARVPRGRLTPGDLASPSLPAPTDPASVLGAALTWLARLTEDTEALPPGITKKEIS